MRSNDTESTAESPPLELFFLGHVGFFGDSFLLQPVFLALQLYKEQRRNSENVSHRSSESDVSEVSAISRTSSASRISSTSYMSIQSERPRGRFRYPGPAPFASLLPSPTLAAL